MNRVNFTTPEQAVLAEIGQGDGRWLISRALLTLCLRPDRIGLENFPTNPRALTRCLGALVRWKAIVRIVTPDHGAWYALKSTWDSLPESMRSEVVQEMDVAVRGTKGRVVIARIGPLREFKFESTTPIFLRVRGKQQFKGIPENAVVGPGRGSLTVKVTREKPANFLFFTLQAPPDPSQS
jgi:hypothetical protein